MFTINGKYNTATVYADQVENSVIGQLVALCSQEVYKDSSIKIMPDCHTGKGCVIGTSMTIQDQITPNLVGVDINCGMYCVQIDAKTIDFNKLDKVIRENIPSGFNIREKSHRFFKNFDLTEMNCIHKISSKDYQRAKMSVGTLGGGNHFIEIDKDENNNFHLVIHTGSRNIGLKVAEYYQKLAGSYKQSGVPFELAPLNLEDTKSYLHDIHIVSEYADQNRQAIADEIMKKMKWENIFSFTTCHNYIDIPNKILRKGAISAQKNEIVLIPLNMKDGSLICKGKGNPDWNFTAPHGAGRICSRGEAKQRFTLSQFKKEMEGIWSTSVLKSTIDEAPMVYKPAHEIIDAIRDTVEILYHLQTVYNFKAS